MTPHDYIYCLSYYTEASKVLPCSQLLIEPIFLNTTLFPAATPRLPLISTPRQSNTTPKRQSTTLPRSTQPQLRRTSITQFRLATPKLLFRTTFTLMLQFTTPRPTLHRSPQVLHRRSRLLHNYVRCLLPSSLHRRI
jgi:hypothetical protein